MLHLNKFRKYIYMLLGAAILLPVIFIAEVAYVEIQQVNHSSQAHADALAKLRGDATAALLSNQTAYVRGMAKLKGISTGDTESAAAELQAFLDAGTGFAVLGYAGHDGRIRVENNGTGGRYIGDMPFFLEALAGREYVGEAPAADWQLGKAVTVIAVPVSVQGEPTGIVYGVIPKETSEVAAIELIPDAAGEPGIERWFAWLGGVYLLGVIPLLFMVYFVRRGFEPAAAHQVSPLPVRKKHVGNKRQTAPRAYEQAAAFVYEPEIKTAEQDEDTAGIQAAIAAVREHQQVQLQPDPAPEPTPAVVIDRVLATAAYKAARQDSAVRQETPVREEIPAGSKFNAVARRGDKQAIRAIEADAKMPEPLNGLRAAKPPLHPEPAEEPAAGQPEPETDTLTGLLVQAGFEKILAARNGQPGDAIITLSIDGMKVINDYLGEPAGDAVILATADIIKAVGGPACTAARTDGDHFVLLVPDFAAGIEDVKKDIKYYIDLHNLRQSGLPLSITIGAANLDRGGSLREVWHKARRDMEKHKNMNRVEARKFIMWSIKRAKGRS
ncbi:diguanylate cyclase domain-containing protein [Sporomusa aerivorans]|uniref:GGDEF domain-containing protein n=1 Tax=Sporomusa aerivorans TaxID=204936 RepID=UPI00352B3E4D